MSSTSEPAAERGSRPAMTLPARYYTDPEYHRREVARLFLNHWIAVGRSEQIAEPGDYINCEIGGESILVTRDVEGTPRAFYNVCRHRGTQICDRHSGRFEGRIQCPYHGWTYGLDGALLGAPHMDPATFDQSQFPLHQAHAAEWEGHVFLHASRDSPAPALAERLAPLQEKFAAWGMADLRLGKRLYYDIQANWKLIVQNYSECLHCPFLHPALNRLTDYLGSDNETPTEVYLGGTMGFRGGSQTMSVDGERRRDYLPGLSQAQRGQVAYYAVFPNLLISLHPDYMMTHTLWPRAVDRTEVICEFHFHPHEMAKRGFEMNDAVEFWDHTNVEDWNISELSQRGISSRAYTPGPYSGRESLLAAFDQLILASEKDSN